MIQLPITLVTASVLAIVYILLSIAVSGERFRSKTGLGSEGSVALGQEHTAPRLLIAVRRHAHFAEYVPLSLILLALLELAGAHRTLLLGLATALIVARIMIVFGLGRAAPNVLRAGGNGLQQLMIIVAAITGLLIACRFI